MTKVIGVRFRTAGKVYFFDPLQLEIKRGDHVIVETARGIEFGTVVAGVHEVEDDKVIQPLKPVMRIAGAKEEEAGLVSVRSRFAGDEGQRSLEQFIADIKEEIAGRVNRPVTVETKENK